MISEDIDAMDKNINDKDVEAALVGENKEHDRSENDGRDVDGRKIDDLEKQDILGTKNGEQSIVWAGGEEEPRENNVIIAERKKKFDVRCLFIGLMVSLILVGTAAIVLLAHKFQDTNYEFRFASHFDNNMVLQRSPHRSVIWGYASFVPENTTVVLELQSDSINQVYYSSLRNTDTGLMWMVRLDERNETTPFNISVFIEHPSYSSNRIKLINVVFGDVWICAGTELSDVPLTEDFYQDLENINNVRIMTLNPSRSDMPWSVVRNLNHSWSLPFKSVLSERSAMCLMFAKQLSDQTKHHVGLIISLQSSSFIYEWSPPHVVEMCESVKIYTNKVSQMWNAMIHPLLGISTYGVIWYQGEMDAIDNPHNYNCTLVELINHWRDRSNRDTQMLFAIIQLVPGNTVQSSYGYADIRWKQTANFGYLPNKLIRDSFLVPSIDLPSMNYTTQRKEVLVERLLRMVLNHQNYTRVGQFIPTRYLVNPLNHSVILTFDNSLISTKSEAGFEVCCSENRSLSCSSSFVKVSYAPGREWVSTPIITGHGNELVLNTVGCPFHVVGLRYLWEESPCQFLSCPVYDRISNSPLSPFIRFDLKDDSFEHNFPDTQVHLI